MHRSAFLKRMSLLALIPAMSKLQLLEKISSHFQQSDVMPVLFLGHGSPMNAIEDNQFVHGFKQIASTLPTPQAILCISAHWYTRGTKVTAMEMPRTIHDFSGFPEALYDVQYPAPGHPALAEETAHVLEPLLVELDEKWGLDHGAWSVIKHLYPKADVPVIQLSIDYSQPPSYHYELAGRLQKLRSKGILIIGSGNIIHNLRMVDFQQFHKDNYGFDWAVEAREKTNQWIAEGNMQALLDYEKQGSALQLAIPTPDHYLPLIYTLGLRQKSDNIHFFNDKLLAGSLSMTSLKIG
ncbi:MAG: 4,5-DOPA dioxygenase extradiol [Saprospiraceae bacterium]|nr:4,5-DOPA dioxygenase extradiol [Saprospiraceae bacterium]